MNVTDLRKPQNLTGHFDGYRDGALHGWVTLAQSDLDLGVIVLIGGRYYGHFAADRWRKDLEADEVGRNGHCAFVIPLDPAKLASEPSSAVEIWVLGWPARLLGRLESAAGPTVQGQFRRGSLRRSATLLSFFGLHNRWFRRKRNGAQDTVQTDPADSHTGLADDRAWLPQRPRALDLCPPRSPAGAEAAREPLSIRIVGHIDGHYSLSGVNRDLALGLSDLGAAIRVNHVHGAKIEAPSIAFESPETRRIEGMLQPWSDTPPDDAEHVSLCQHYPLIKDEREARLRVAMFFWEESLVPHEHIAHLNENFDALIVASNFVRKVLRDSGCKLPIRVVPLGVGSAYQESSAEPPQDAPAIGASAAPARQRMRFLHVSSAFPRKGVDVLLAAYFAEFTHDEPVELLIKTFANIHNDVADQIAHFRETHPDAAPVEVDESFLTERELADLYRASDVVVLPTRGEGFNLPAAEAMLSGRPVIATGYGAHTDFLTAQTGWCLDYDFAPAESHFREVGSLWVDPNARDLRRMMREFLSAWQQGQASCLPGLEGSVGGQDIRTTIQNGKELVRSIYNRSASARCVDSYIRDLLRNRNVTAAPLRLALISSWASHCGIAEYTKDLLTNFSGGAFEIIYVTDSRAAASDNILPLYSISPTEDLSRALDFVEAGSFDAILVQHQASLFDILGSSAGRLAELQRRSPVILELHATAFLDHIDRDRVARGVLHLRQLERILVHTPADLTRLKRLGLIENVALFPLGIHVRHDDGYGRADALLARRAMARSLAAVGGATLSERNREEIAARLQDGTFWMASFGFLLPHKGLAELIEAVKLLHDADQTGVRLLLACATLDERSERVGDDLRALIDRLGLSTAVVLVTDFLTVDEASTLLSSADLLTFVYRSTGESASAAVRIALGTGRPVLTTPEPIFNDIRGFTHRTANETSEAIAAAILPLIEDRQALNQFYDDQQKWLSHHTWDRLSTRLANMIVGACADRDLASKPLSRRSQGVPSTASLAADEPLCPPGIPYPRTGRARSWLRRDFRLEPVAEPRTLPADAFDGTTRSATGIPVSWNSRTLALEVMDADGNSRLLHLVPEFRTTLNEAWLTVADTALFEVPERERPALFQYARRHQIRSLLTLTEADGRTGPWAFLADVVQASSADLRDRWRDALAGGSASVDAGRHLPQIHLADGDGAALQREACTLRGLAVQVGRGIQSPLLDALREEALDMDRRLVSSPIHFGADPNRQWVLASLSSEEESMPSRPGQRVAVLMDGAAVAACEASSRRLERLIGEAAMFVFEHPEDYARFFATLCATDHPIALVRGRSVLLEADEDGSGLVDRFCRIFREMYPLRLRELAAVAPDIERPPLARNPVRLSVCVSTYNRADWLSKTLPLLAQDLSAHRDQVEFLVVDNASTDHTPQVMQELAAAYDIKSVRNAENVGMLGNLAVTAQLAAGDFVWILGDDDLVKLGTTALILNAIEAHPRSELVYINYAYTYFDRPSDLSDVDGLLESATPIATETPAAFHDEIREFAANNENFFTAIYACVFRRDQALAAYSQYTSAPPFSDMASCIPTTKHVLEQMLDRPGYWIGSNQIVVNMNVSWMRYAPVWHIERLPETYDLAEAMGVPADALRRYRISNVGQATHFVREGFGEDDQVRNLLSLPRYVERLKRLGNFKDRSADLFANYDQALQRGSRFGDDPTTGTLRAIYRL
ncbi:glycosyltransferase [Methylobacterium durans]|uniref:Glycosyltransferase 2-like domain-containing protein n=1 Tax=Methylobacterium durans TaxID=2202825 RepID=A0A2U8W1F8_9HYPH|nr:glycosyltransferase [Methylobacterium durans]AWN39897.1 hypothetical protein DK389_04285 [Methylobacterium durans]